VIEVLTRHFANDDLSEAQLEARFQAVYAATTRRELDAIIADLPTAIARETTDITATFSGQERKLAGVVLRDLKLRARLGYVELDLTQATFEPGVTTIDVSALMGYVQIWFPAGVRVETAGRALFGYFAIKGAVGDAPAIVRITGRARFGFVEALLPSP
jgi:predicted membrane protein